MNAENKHKNNLQEKDLKQNDRISIRLSLLVFESPGKKEQQCKDQENWIQDSRYL